MKNAAKFTVLLAIAVEAGAISARAPAVAADSTATNCVRGILTPEMTICNDSELRQADAEIAQLYAELLGIYSGDDRTLFAAGQDAWLRERNNCQNNGATEPECVHDKLLERVALLQALASNPSKLIGTAADYEFIEPWYLDRFGAAYAGKRIHLFGEMEADICAKRSALTGRIKNDGAAVEVEFKSLSRIDETFLCEKHPEAWWTGQVTMVGAKPVLYLTDILGRKLP